MPINFNILNANPVQQKSNIIPLPSSGGGGDSIGDIFSGLSSIAGAFSQKPTSGYAGPGTGSNVLGGLMKTQQPMGLQSYAQNMTKLDSGHLSIFQNAEKNLGLKEGDSGLTNFLQKSNPNLDPTQTPWCAGFVGSVLNASGSKGSGSLAAKSYLKVGTPTNTPSKGDIVVFNDLSGNNDPAHGHVGFVQEIDPQKGFVKVLGGNQSNSVSVQIYPLSKVAGFRVPPTGQQIARTSQQMGIQTPNQLSTAPKIINNQQVVSNPSSNAPQSDLQHTLNGIAYVETGRDQGNPYVSKSIPSRNGDRAYGKYQIMGTNIPSWTKEATGTAMTPAQFLSSPEAQDKTASYMVQQNLNKGYSPEDVASIWFSGRPQKKAGNARDAYGTTVPEYIKIFNKGYGKSKDGVSYIDKEGRNIPFGTKPINNPAPYAPSYPRTSVSMNGINPVIAMPLNNGSPNEEIPQAAPIETTQGINWELLNSFLNSSRQA